MEFITENGRAVSRIGQGTWYLGENAATAARERKALQAGVEAGMNLIDTAEMYGEGTAEHLIGSAIRGMGRASLYLVSKVYPFNADRRSIFLSCENSLRRLGTDYLDLYQLHWRGSVPLAEHTLDNAAALNLVLSADELAALDAAFPAPNRRTPLDIV